MITGQRRLSRYCTKILSMMYQAVNKNIMRQRIFQSRGSYQIVGACDRQTNGGGRDNNRRKSRVMLSLSTQPTQPTPPSRPATSLFHVFQNNAVIFMLPSSMPSLLQLIFSKDIIEFSNWSWRIELSLHIIMHQRKSWYAVFVFHYWPVMGFWSLALASWKCLWA